MLMPSPAVWPGSFYSKILLQLLYWYIYHHCLLYPQERVTGCTLYIICDFYLLLQTQVKVWYTWAEWFFHNQNTDQWLVRCLRGWLHGYLGDWGSISLAIWMDGKRGGGHQAGQFRCLPRIWIHWWWLRALCNAFWRLLLSGPLPSHLSIN